MFLSHCSYTFHSFTVREKRAGADCLAKRQYFMSASLSLKALKHFLPLLMDFYSAFQPWSTFIGLAFHFWNPHSLYRSHFCPLCTVCHSCWPLHMPSETWLLFEYECCSKWFIFESLSRWCVLVHWPNSVWVVLGRIKVHSATTATAAQPSIPEPICAKCLLWFWVRFNSRESKIVLGILVVWVQVSVFQGRTNLSSLATGQLCTGSKLLSRNTPVFE